jgi:RHS repeat-associated protein
MGCLKLTYREIPEADFFLSSEKTIGDAGNRSFWDVKSDHLGNVRVVLSDARNSVGLTSVTAAYDYYPFGQIARSIDGGARFLFNGMEREDNITGVAGGHYDFGARIYDPRLGRWLALDPKISQYPSLSGYHFAYNSPIVAIDPNGESGEVVVDKKNNTITIKANIVFYGNITATQAKNAAKGIQDSWNAPSDVNEIFLLKDESGNPTGFKYNYKGKPWTVRFEVTAEVKSESEVKAIAEKNVGKTMNNYIRVEESNPDDDNGTKMATGNSGFWLSKDLNGKTPAHEGVHIFGKDEHSFYVGQDNPDIGISRTPLEEFGIDPNTRTVQKINIQNVFETIETFGNDITTSDDKAKGLKFGSTNTQIFNKDGKVNKTVGPESSGTFNADIGKTQPKEQAVKLGK